MTTHAFLLIDVAGTRCALARAAVREVLPLPRLHAPPTAGGPVAGFIDLAGTPLVTIDLARLFGLDRAAGPGAYAHVVRLAEAEIGLVVDRVLDVVAVEAESVRAVNDARSFNGCVAAEIARDCGLVHVLDPARLVTLEERQRLEAYARRAGQRLAAIPA